MQGGGASVFGFCLALAVVLPLPGCFLVARSFDSTVAGNLQLSLYASTGHYSPDGVSFELFFNSTDEVVWPGGRDILVTANGVPLKSPRSWSIAERFGTVQRETYYGYRRCSLWHFSEPRLAAWLGGPGRYTLRAHVGPAHSNDVVLECDANDRVTILFPGTTPRDRA